MRTPLAAVLAVAVASAPAQIDITSPVSGDEELAGQNTIVTFNIAPNLQSIRGRVRDGGLLEFRFEILGLESPPLTPLDGPAFYSEANGNTGIRVDLSEVDLTFFFGLGSTLHMTMKCRTLDGNSRYETAPSASDEASDESIRLIHPNHPRPALAGISADSETGVLRLVFNEPLTNLDPLNADNNTQIQTLSGDEFQFSVSPEFDGSEPTVAGLSNPRLEDGNPSVLLFDYDTPTSAFTTGYIRPAYGPDDEPLAGMDLRSPVGYPAASSPALLVIPDPFVPGDITGDGVVDSGDLAIILSGWGACPDQPARAKTRAPLPNAAPSRGSYPINITNPVIGDEEFAGLDTVVTFDVAPGLGSGGVVLDGEAIETSFDIINVTGDVIFGPFPMNIIGGAVNYVDAVGNVGVQADLGSVVFSSVIAHPVSHALRFKIRTSGGTAMQFESAPFDAEDETLDESIEVLLPDDAPALTSALADGKTNTLSLTFSTALTTFDPVNDQNHTNPALVDGNDFQFSMSPMFTGAEETVTGIANARFENNDPTTLVFDFAEGVSNLVAGGHIRPAYLDNNFTPSTAMSVRDILGHNAASDAVEVQLANICPSDLNGDGVTDSSDLAIVLASWTP